MSMILLLASCSTPRLIPKALNTVATATFADLNLTNKDYSIQNTVTAEAVVTVTYARDWTQISEEQGEFQIRTVKTKKGTEVLYKGVLRMGYLFNDYNYDPSEKYSPEDVARRLAIYRLINIAKANGADGVIEPIISTNVEQVSKDKVVLKTTASAKILTLTSSK